MQQRGNGVAAVSDDAVQGHYETFNRTEPPRKRGRATPGLEAVKTPGRPKQEGNAASNGDIPALTLTHRLNPFFNLDHRRLTIGLWASLCGLVRDTGPQGGGNT